MLIICVCFIIYQINLFLYLSLYQMLQLPVLSCLAIFVVSLHVCMCIYSVF